MTAETDAPAVTILDLLPDCNCDRNRVGIIDLGPGDPVPAMPCIYCGRVIKVYRDIEAGGRRVLFIHPRPSGPDFRLAERTDDG